MSMTTYQQQPSNPQKRARQRALRACDACRKMKIKCIMSSGDPPCEACKLSARSCKFEHVGVKREKPPSIREIEQLNRKIAQLEAVLIRLRPQIDLSSLPRTNDQAKTMANALQGSVAHPIPAPQPTAFPSQTPASLPPNSIKPNSSFHPSINEEEDLDDEDSESDDDSYDEDEGDDDGDRNFQAMLKSLGKCQIGTSHLLDHDKSSSAQTPPQNHSLTSNQNANDNNNNANNNTQDQSLSMAEKYCVQRFELEAYLMQNWPDPDLADSLISIYFDTIFSYPPIVHQSEFRTQYQSGLANRDPQFAQLCFAIFAAASPYSDDPRVLYVIQPNDPYPRQSAGALFAFTAIFRIFKPAPLGLFQLQTMAVMSFYLLRMSNPGNTSATVQKFMRKAISSGVHLENSPQWNCSLLRDQLRKRAFSVLIMVDKLTSKTLDYLRIPRVLPNLVVDPLYVDDAELDLLDAQDMLQPTQAMRKNFREKLGSSTQTPGKAAVEAVTAIRRKLEVIFQNMVLNQLNNPTQPSSTNTPASSTDENPLSKSKAGSQQFTLQVSSLLGHVIETEMPLLGKWNPSLTKKEDLHHTAMSTCLLRCFQIIVLLQVITIFPELSQTCFQAACIVVDILEDLKVLGHLNLLDAAIPHFLCPVGLIFLWVISQDKNPYISTDTKANAWLKMKSCIEILNILTPASFVSAKLSEKFTDYMKRLEEEAHCPTMMNNSHSTAKKPSKRPFSEIMAQKLQKPTVSNFLNSQYSSPDGKSNDSSDDHRATEKLKSLEIHNISDIISIVDSFQTPSPDPNSNQNPIQVNPLDGHIQTQTHTPCPNLQLHDLFPSQSETPLNPPPNWDYRNGLLPFAGNQSLPTKESPSTLSNPPIHPVDGFVNFSSAARQSFDVPSAHLQPSTTASSSFMPTDRSNHLVGEGGPGLVRHHQSTTGMPMNSINSHPAHNLSYYVDRNDKNLSDSGLNPIAIPVNTLNMNEDFGRYQRLAGSSITRDPISTTINCVDPSKLINTTPSSNPLHHQQQQPRSVQDPPDYSSLFTTQFGPDPSIATTLKLHPSSADLNQSSNSMVREQPIQFNTLMDGSSAGFVVGSLPSTASSNFNNQLDVRLPRSFTTTTLSQPPRTSSLHRHHHSISKFEPLNPQNSTSSSTSVEFMDQKGLFNPPHQHNLLVNNPTRTPNLSHSRSQSYIEPTSHFSAFLGSSNNHHNYSAGFQNPLTTPTSTNNPNGISSFNNLGRTTVGFNLDLADPSPINNLAQNDLNDIFSSICSSWLF